MKTVLTLAGAYGLPQMMDTLLGGTITKGNRVVPVYYPNYVNLWPDFTGQTGTITWTKAMFDFVHKNVIAGAAILNDQLHDAATQYEDDIDVFTHSMGSWVATAWLRDYALNSPIDPDRVRFVLLGNSARKYGGLFQADVNGGVPQGNPFEVIDFAKQFDGWADWPGDPQVITSIDAALNAYQGMSSTHLQYQGDRLDNPNNLSYEDSSTNVTYMWSMTYPVPILGAWATPSTDSDYRSNIEAAYNRPVDIPRPDYIALSGINPPGPGATSPGWFVVLASTNAKQKVLLHSSAHVEVDSQTTYAAQEFTLKSAGVIDDIGTIASQSVDLGSSAGVELFTDADNSVMVTSSADIAQVWPGSAAPQVIPPLDSYASASVEATGHSSAVVHSSAVIGAAVGAAQAIPGVRSGSTAIVNSAATQHIPALVNAAESEIASLPVEFDAVSHGSSVYGTTITWSHTAQAGAFVVCFVVTMAASAPPSATYAGMSMSLLGTNGNMAILGLANVPGGVQSVVVNSAAGTIISAGVESCINAESYSVVPNASGSASPAEQNVTVEPNQRVVQAFGAPLGSTITSLYGGTNRAHFSYTGNYAMLVMNDSDQTDTFGVTGWTKPWEGMAVVLSS